MLIMTNIVVGRGGGISGTDTSNSNCNKFINMTETVTMLNQNKSRFI